jgi:hypothetical protein
MPGALEIDLDEVRKLAQMGCTQQEIATLLRFSRRTFANRQDLLDAYEDGKASLCKSLRRRQVEMAMEGNQALLVWLGKNLLGQSDKQEINTNMRDIVVRIGGPSLSETTEGDDEAAI